jgi:hypothetical protein
MAQGQIRGSMLIACTAATLAWGVGHNGSGTAESDQRMATATLGNSEINGGFESVQNIEATEGHGVVATLGLGACALRVGAQLSTSDNPLYTATVGPETVIFTSEQELRLDLGELAGRDITPGEACSVIGQLATAPVHHGQLRTNSQQ